MCLRRAQYDLKATMVAGSGRDGIAINPMGVPFSVATRGADPGAVRAIKARLAELLKVGTKG